MKKLILTLFLVGLTVTCFSQETYTLSDKSTLTIEGSSTVHDWTVTANTMEGTFQGDTKTVNSVDFSVVVADIVSDRAAAMDKKMHEALKQDEYPQVLFSATGIDASIGGGQDLNGTLNIAGVENTVAVPVSISETDGKLKISGEQKITLKDYNIEPPTAMFGSIVVGDDVTVKFDLIFAR